MAANGGVVLFNSSLVGAGSSQVFTYNGGQGVIVVSASVYGVGTLQYVQAGVSKTPIVCCSSFVSNAIIPFNAPAGSYCYSQASGSSVALTVALIPAR